MRTSVATKTMVFLWASVIALAPVAPAHAGFFEKYYNKYRNYRDEKKIKKLDTIDKSNASPMCLNTRSYYLRNCPNGKPLTSYCKIWMNKCNFG